MIGVTSDYGRFPGGLICASAFWGLIFAFFAFKKSDDATICLASNSGDLVREVPTVDGVLNTLSGMVDVSERLHVFFTIGMYLCAAQLVIALLTRLVDQRNFIRLLHSLYEISQACFLLTWIYGFYIRFTPSGQACCGTWDKKFLDGELYQ